MYRRILTSLLLYTVFLAGSAAAVAGDSVSMPYDCLVQGARVVLKPSQARRYPIIGEREERHVTACASPGAVDCRTVVAHRFRISCAGRQVAWMRVVAAARRNPSRPIWIQDGRMHLAVERRAGTPSRCRDSGRMLIGSPRASRAEAGGDACQPWRRDRDAGVVALPPGFAPLADIGARLLVAGAETPPRPILAALPPEKIMDRAPTVPPSAPLPVVEAVPRLEKAMDRTSAAGQTTGQPVDTAPIPAVLTGAESPRTWVTMVRPEAMPEVASLAYGPAPSILLVATLLAALLAVVAWKLRRVERNLSVARFSFSTPGFRDRMRAGAARVANRVAGGGSSGRLSRGMAGRFAASPAETSVTNAAASVTALIDQANGSVSELVGAPPLREVLDQELGVIRQRLAIVKAQASEGPEAAHKAAPVFRALVRDLERVRRISESAALSLSGVRTLTRMPRTCSEAYDVLGVHADVNPETLKRLVDALRMCWHPDLARDESDRLHREERIKVINVAWELITGKRTAA